MATMSKKDQDAIAAAGEAWTKANAAGDKAGMEAAHAQAEAIRASYGYSGGDDGTQHITVSNKTGSSSGSGSSSSSYTPTGKGSEYYSGQYMSAADQQKLKEYGEAYNNATTDSERKEAHDAAEALRAQYGYIGGTDGSDYIKLSDEEEKANASGGFSYESAPTYTDKYQTKIDELLNQILNREGFSYDAESDDLYQQYKAQYEQEGQRAMKDTLGEVSARTGGMASSWAGSMSQQAYDYYASKVADKVPELYQLAYQMYLNDIDQQVTDLGLLEGVSDTAYNRYRDTMSDWRDDRDFAYGKYRDDVADGQWQQTFDYNANRDALSDERYNQEWEYNVGRDQVDDERYNSESAYERVMQMLSAGVMPSSELLSEAGLSTSQASTLMAAYASTGSGKSSSSSGSSSSKAQSTSGTVQDYDGLFAAAQESGHAKSFIANNYKNYGFTSSTGLYNDYESWAEGLSDAEEGSSDGLTREDWDQLNSLGIGLVDIQQVQELIQYGGLIEDASGRLQWANGWNPANYLKMLNEAKAQGFGVMNGLFDYL